MTHAMLIQELQPEGERWRISVRELSVTSVLMQEMFPFGMPPGVTIAEDIVIEQPDLIGSFLIGGLTSDTLQHMDPDYAQHFRDAGLVPHSNSMALEGSPQEGMVRTWFAGIDQPFDMAADEALELHADNWSGATLPDITVYDHVDDQVITFTYDNGMTYPILLNTIAQSQQPAERLLNHSNFLIIPADESLNPVISARTCPRMFELRVVLVEKDKEFKAQQIEIGYMINEFATQIRKLAHGARWRSPVDAFRDGLGKK